MKPFQYSAAVLACLMALAACSDKNAQNTTQNAAATEGKPVEITFWHSMEGQLGVELQKLVEQFNKDNPQYHITAVYKGAYGESMNAAIAAYRAKQAPDIVQIFEVGTATMLNSNGAIKPVQEMSEEVGNPIDPKEFLGAIAGYYSSTDGKLVSMPFNSSSAVMYYNKDLFRKAGLDPEKAPKTYAELREDAKKLRNAGVSCGYTTAWPSWILMENASAWHNTPYATENNGFGGLGARLSINNPVMNRLLSTLADMAKEGTFTYSGRGDTANSAFISGQCGILTASSGSRAQLAKDGKFDFGIAPLPYLADVPGAPQNTVIGGGSLWVFNGKDKPVYEGITQFFHFLASPEIAAKWHQESGYLPITTAAYKLSEKDGYYTKTPGSDVAIKELDVVTTDASRGIRLGSLPEIRNVEEGYLEQIFNGKIPVEQALADMTEKGNDILARFEKDHAH